MDKAAIYGAGGQARVIASILRAKNIEILGCFDDSFSDKMEIIQGRLLLGTFRDIYRYKNQIAAVYLAIGDNFKRAHAYKRLKSEGFQLPFLIHPRSVIEPDVSIDEASVVCIGAKLCTEVKVGKGCILNTGCSVDHECVIGDFVHLAPQVAVAGRVEIGNYTFIGINASVADKLKIGSHVIIGAGSVILRDVPDGAKVVGVYH